MQIYKIATRFLLQWRSEQGFENRERLEKLCKYLLISLEAESPKFSYIGVFLNKELSLLWIKHIKNLLYKCCLVIEQLKPGRCNIVN